MHGWVFLLSMQHFLRFLCLISRFLMLLSRSQTVLIIHPWVLVKEREWRPVDALNSVSITKLNPVSSSFHYDVSLIVSMRKPRCNTCLKASITVTFPVLKRVASSHSQCASNQTSSQWRKLISNGHCGR